MKKEILQSQYHSLVVEKELAETDTFRLYACSEGENWFLLKIATEKKYNRFIEKEHFILDLLQEKAQALEEEWAKVKKDESFLNYHFFFPSVVEVFAPKGQNNRKALLLSFSSISKKRSDLSPLSFLLDRDRVAVDPRTSAWIIGKLLKMLVFTHSEKILIGKFNADTILINREQHFVTVFDWSYALSENSISKEKSRNEIAAIAQIAVMILGGKPLVGTIPPHQQLVDDRYQDFLQKMLDTTRFMTAVDAHRDFYELVHSLWPREFWPFTTQPL